jgi:chromosome segregation ATPase
MGNVQLGTNNVNRGIRLAKSTHAQVIFGLRQELEQNIQQLKESKQALITAKQREHHLHQKLMTSNKQVGALQLKVQNLEEQVETCNDEILSQYDGPPTPNSREAKTIVIDDSQNDEHSSH